MIEARVARVSARARIVSAARAEFSGLPIHVAEEELANSSLQGTASSQTPRLEQYRRNLSQQYHNDNHLLKDANAFTTIDGSFVGARARLGQFGAFCLRELNQMNSFMIKHK